MKEYDMQHLTEYYGSLFTFIFITIISLIMFSVSKDPALFAINVPALVLVPGFFKARKELKRDGYFNRRSS